MCNTHYEQLRRRGLLVIRPKDPAERFWTWVERTDGCWLWTGSKSIHGYGRVFWDGVQQQAHRVAYELIIGPIPQGMHIDHVAARGCVHRHCVRPEHLEPVTPAENVLRGRGFAAVNGRKTHCVNGHEYTPENTIEVSKGRRCRECARDLGKKRAAKEKLSRQAKLKETDCRICGAHFTDIGKRRTLCSEECRKESARRSAREHQRRKRAA